MSQGQVQLCGAVWGIEHVGWRCHSNQHSGEKKDNVFTWLFVLPLPFLLSVWTPPFLPPLPLYFTVFLPSPPSFSHSFFFSFPSSAADCCPSYLCSRLGMFFLLITSIPPPSPLHPPALTSLPVFCLGCCTCPCFRSFFPPIWNFVVVYEMVGGVFVGFWLVECVLRSGLGRGLAPEQPIMGCLSFVDWLGEAVRLFVHSKHILLKKKKRSRKETKPVSVCPDWQLWHEQCSGAVSEHWGGSCMAGCIMEICCMMFCMMSTCECVVMSCPVDCSLLHHSVHLCVTNVRLWISTPLLVWSLTLPWAAVRV